VVSLFSGAAVVLPVPEEQAVDVITIAIPIVAAAIRFIIFLIWKASRIICFVGF
jgi:hypothetical protein